MSAGRSWMRLSRFLTTAALVGMAGGEVSQAVLHVRPDALDRDRRRMGSLQARKHFSDLDRPECGPGRGP